MAVSLNWDNDQKSILKVTFTGDVTAADFIQAFTRQSELLASVPHNVCVVADFREITRIPITILSASSSLSGRTFPNLVGLAVVGSNPILRAIMDVWSRLYKQMTMVSTLEAAELWADSQLAQA